MIVTRWNNGWGNTSVTFGFRINRNDRDRHFNRDWNNVILILDGIRFTFNLSEIFWEDCPEIRGSEIGQYFINHGHVDMQNRRWTNDLRQFTLTHLNDNIFEVS